MLLFSGIVGRISPKTWSAMEVFLASIATEEYESMASALIQMGATNQDVDAKAFARDLNKMFSSIQANNFKSLDNCLQLLEGISLTCISSISSCRN